MSDARLRDLERRAAQGEPVLHALHQEQLRAGLLPTCPKCDRKLRTGVRRSRARLITWAGSTAVPRVSCTRPSRTWCWGSYKGVTIGEMVAGIEAELANRLDVDGAHAASSVGSSGQANGDTP